MRYIIWIIGFSFLLLGCKSSKAVSDVAVNSNTTVKLSVKQLLKKHKKQQSQFKTLQSRLKVKLNNGQGEKTISLSLRMERDKIIWISAPLNIVRIKLTQDKIAYYNKLENTYFEGGFELVQELFGVKLTFENIQNILLGQLAFDLRAREFYKASNLELKTVKFILNFQATFIPDLFKIRQQQVIQSVPSRSLNINYKKYQRIEDQNFPEKIVISTKDMGQKSTIDVALRSLSLNDKLRFPFKIPVGYQLLQIE
jgi:hypothetical protein